MTAHALPQIFEPFLKLVGPKEEAESPRARSALEQLCERGRKAGKGFEPKTLAFCLNMIRLLLDSKARGRTPKPLCYGDKKGDYFTAKDLRGIAKRARKLQGEIRKLRLTNLIFEALVAGQLTERDLLAPEFTDEGKYVDKATGLMEVTELPRLWRWYRTNRLHGTDGSLWRLCQYIDKTTGGPNDSLLVDILQPLKVAHCTSPDALKVWRTRVTSKVTGKGRKQALPRY